MNRRTILSCLCIFVGYAIYGIYAASLRFDFYFPTEVYWLSFVFVSIPILYGVAYWNNNPKLRLFCLLSFSLLIHLQYAMIDASPLLSSEDAVADYNLTSKIIADSKWTLVKDNEWYFGYEYQFYPITNFIYATMTMLTGIPLILVVKYLFIIKALVVPFLVERVFGRFFNKQVAYLATMIFLASPGAILFPHKESFAVIFFFLSLYAIIKSVKYRIYALIGLLSILTLVMTHHFTTYIFLGTLVALYFSTHFFYRQKGVIMQSRQLSQYLLFCLTVFAAWVGFISYTIITQHQSTLINFFLMLTPGRTTFSELAPLYPLYERTIIFIGLGITAFSAVLGFIAYVKDKKRFSFSFFSMSILFIILLAIGSLFRFSSHNENIIISHRTFEFGYIAIGAFSGLFFFRVFKLTKKLSLKAIFMGAIVIMITAGPIMGAMHPGSMNTISHVISFKSISLNVWMSESNANEEYTVGDHLVYFALSIYGDSKVAEYPELFVNHDFSLPLDVRSNWSYVVTYSYMADLYGSNAITFADKPIYDTIYTNGILNVYGVTNRTSS